jgi:glycosyltransferase involved in cell wall biosynthesis
MTGDCPSVQIDVIIIAQNEELNIRYSVASAVGWAHQVFVVDAHSSDATADMARLCGAQVYQHEFIDWADQRNWALAHLPLAADWVLFLDADEVLTANFKAALPAALNSAGDERFGAVALRFEFRFLGKTLRHAYGHPPIVRLVRKGRARWFAQGAREHCVVDGDVIRCDEPVMHMDRRGISYWIEKQNRNATRDARSLVGKPTARATTSTTEVVDRAGRLWLRERVYDRAPLYLRPFLYFPYRYIVRLGFLDGKEGFVYCFLQAFWYPLLIAAKTDEMRLRNDSGEGR